MVILGAGGHANEVLDVLSVSRSSAELFLFDDTGADTNISHNRFFQLLRSELQLKEAFLSDPAFCVAVGNPRIRQKMTALAIRHGGQPENAIAHTAYISPVASIGLGINVMHMAYISPGAIVEEGVLINAGGLIHHDVIVGRYAEISPGATLLGGSTVEPFVRIGARAVIMPGVLVGEGAVVGAGAVVLRNVLPGEVVVGVPAKPQTN